VKKRSVIQSTMINATILIFCILVMLYFFFARIYWQKEVLSRQFELLSIASKVELKIQANYQYINNFKENEKLEKNERIMLANNMLLNFMNMNSKQNPQICIGYYDLDLDASIASASMKTEEYWAGQLNHSEISAKLSESNIPEYISNTEVNSWDGQGVIGVAVPVFYKNKMVGYTWALREEGDIFYKSYLDYCKVFVPSILLWILALFLIKKNIVNIKVSLDTFSRMILNCRVGNKESTKDMEQLERLPELKPVFEKIREHLDCLEGLNNKLEESNDKLLTIMEGITDGFLSLDRNWRYTFINEEARRMMGKEENEVLIGKELWDMKPEMINPDSVENLKVVMAQNMPLHWETIATDGRIFQIHAYPFAQGLSIFIADITEVKKQESELVRLERLNLIGQMAAGISHEVRNPLTIVRGFLQMLEGKADSDQNKEYMEIMISEIDRANEIITDFLSLAKANAECHIHANINEIITRIFPMLQADAFNSDRNIELYLGDIPKLALNESEIRQLILNLVRNGLEESPENGTVSIRTYQEKSQVVLAISDQGRGIPLEVQEKMGTPFITTKETGTGLGLAISMGIAKRHKAKFEFVTESTGTTFYIKFPCENGE